MDDLDGAAAIGCTDHVDLMVLEYGGQGEDVARVIIDHEDLFSVQDFVGTVQPFEHALLFRRQVGDDAVQKQGGFV